MNMDLLCRILFSSTFIVLSSLSSIRGQGIHPAEGVVSNFIFPFKLCVNIETETESKWRNSVWKTFVSSDDSISIKSFFSFPFWTNVCLRVRACVCRAVRVFILGILSIFFCAIRVATADDVSILLWLENEMKWLIFSVLFSSQSYSQCGEYWKWMASSGTIGPIAQWAYFRLQSTGVESRKILGWSKFVKCSRCRQRKEGNFAVGRSVEAHDENATSKSSDANRVEIDKSTNIHGATGE